MRYASAILISSLVILSACTRVGAPSGTSRSSASVDRERLPSAQSSSTHSRAPSEASDSPIWTMIREWAPSLSWSAPVSGTNDDVIIIDDIWSLPAGSVDTQFITATDIAYADFERIFSGSRDDLDSTAQAQGWSRDVQLDADGPHGTVWGYRMEASDGIRFLIIVATGTDCETTDDSPAQCRMFTARASLTDSVSFGVGL